LPPSEVVRVSSPDDLRVAGYADLIGRSRRADHLDRCFVVEGTRAIRQAMDVGWPLQSVLLLDTKVDRVVDVVESASRAGVPVFVADEELFSGLAGFPVHRGALALAARPPERQPTEIITPYAPVLVIEAVNDHENLGALFRNAAGFGVGAVLLDPRCADPLYRRSVRVSLGHVMAVPFARVHPWPEAVVQVREAGLELVALTPRAEASIDVVAAEMEGRPVAVIVGCEADGLSAAALALADHAVRIPMAAGVDSLNVATAAAIALHRFTGPGSRPAS
jgi:tRNA G18 (ribose-2'-O)-methylase SpoU